MSACSKSPLVHSLDLIRKRFWRKYSLNKKAATPKWLVFPQRRNNAMKSLSDKAADLAVHILYKKETTSYFWSVREKALDSKSILVRFWNQYRYTKLIQSHNHTFHCIQRSKASPSFPMEYTVFLSLPAQKLGRDVSSFIKSPLAAIHLLAVKGTAHL